MTAHDRRRSMLPPGICPSSAATADVTMLTPASRGPLGAVVLAPPSRTASLGRHS